MSGPSMTAQYATGAQYANALLGRLAHHPGRAQAELSPNFRLSLWDEFIGSR
jgi:hypothetical protein